MKRSEILDYIYFSVKHLDDQERFEKKELMEFAERLLRGLEERGMSPPYTTFNNEFMHGQIRKWDDE
jgi:hypothetical protein